MGDAGYHERQVGRVGGAIAVGSLTALTWVSPLGNPPVWAQPLQPDQTLGSESSVVEAIDPLNDRIVGGAQRGANLFHSFSEFNVGEGRGVFFANPIGIENILSRVTGQNPSFIFGQLGVLGPSNLFLLNPNGILFGPNASLDIQGSFHASTATGIGLGDQGLFSATEPQQSTLLSVSPGSLFFNQVAAQPASIINRGNLAVGDNLTLSAQNLDLQGQLFTGGDLTLAALNTIEIHDDIFTPFVAASGGQLLVQGDQFVNISALNHPNSVLFSGGDLVLRSNSPILGDANYISTSQFLIEQLNGSLGSLLSPFGTTIQANGDILFDSYSGASLQLIAGGAVFIPGIVNVTESGIINPGVEVITLSDNSTTIQLNPTTEPTLDVRSGVVAFNGPFLSVGTPPTSSDIIIGNIELIDNSLGESGRVFLSNQYQPNNSLNDLFGGISIDSINTADLFRGGNITIDARSDIALSGLVSTSAVDLSTQIDAPLNTFVGNAGTTTLLAQRDIILNPDSAITANGQLGGEISINSGGDILAFDSLIESNTFIDSQNVTSDKISIAAHAIALIDGSQVSSSTFGAGNSGGIEIDANDEIILAGVFGRETFSGLNSNVEIGASGNSGGIVIDAGSLRLENGARINANNSSQGNAGSILITAESSISLSGGNREGIPSFIGSQVNPDAVGGNTSGVILNTDTLTLDDGARISGDIAGIGNSGSVIINASENILLTGETQLRGRDVFEGSAISSLVFPFGEGNSGGIMIQVGRLSLDQGGAINSSTLGAGNAGPVKIEANDISIEGESSSGIISRIFSQTGEDQEGIELGDAGGIEINTETLHLDRGAQIAASTFGEGNTRLIQITANNFISLTGVDRRGVGSNILSQALENARGATEGILLQADELKLNDGAFISTSTLGNGDTGPIQIIADSVSLEGASTASSSSLFSQVEIVSSEGNSGGIIIETETLNLDNSAQIAASTFGVGNTGKIKIDASDSISVGNGSTIFSQVSNDAIGNTDGIVLHSGSIFLREDSVISTSTLGKGNSGSLKITARDSITLDSNSALLSQAYGSKISSSGDIEIDTSSLSLDNGAVIEANILGNGHAGPINISANNIFVTGRNTERSSSIQSSIRVDAEGETTGIQIDTDSLSLTSSGFLSSSIFGIGKTGLIEINAENNIILSGRGSGIFSQVGSGGIGKSGGVKLSAKFLDISDASVISVNNLGQGDSGAIYIDNHQSISINGLGSGIFSELNLDGSGTSGDIVLKSATLSLTDQSQISTNAISQGVGGNIQISASDSIRLSGGDSGGLGSAITSSADQGFSGDIAINTHSLEIIDGSVIKADTSGIGSSGRIQINAEDTVSISGENIDGLEPNSEAEPLVLDSLITSTVRENATGSSGGIEIHASSLTLNDGARISSDSIGDGNTGLVKLNISNTVLLSGTDSQELGSSITSIVGPDAFGSSAGIDINAGLVLLEDGAIIGSDVLGHGNSGLIRITATDGITLSRNVGRGRGSAITSRVDQNASGSTRGIEINTDFLLLNDGSQILADTHGAGNTGAVNVNALSRIELAGERLGGSGSQITSDVEPGALGASGGIEINTGSLVLTQGANISSSTFANGNSGAIRIVAEDSILISGDNGNGFVGSITSLVGPRSSSSSGGIEISTRSLQLDRAGISASQFGAGNSGPIQINAQDKVILNGGDPQRFGGTLVSEVRNGATGSTSGIFIHTGSLILNDGARISSDTLGDGNSGLFRANVLDMLSLSGNDDRGSGSSITSNIGINSNGTTNGLEINTGSLALNNGATISSDTFGKGNSGSIEINAHDIRLIGEDVQGVDSSITTVVRATSEGSTSGINIHADSLSLIGGTRIRSDTFSVGNAGPIKINLQEDITLSGNDSSGTGSLISSRVGTDANGSSGGIKINAEAFYLNDGASIFSDIFGSGNAGVLKLTAQDTIVLDGNDDNSTGSSITSILAGTATGVSGGIDITTGSLRLLNGAAIGTSPLGAGSSGPITINARDSIELDGIDNQGRGSGITSIVFPGSVTSSGGIGIQAESLSIQNNAGISTSSLGTANGEDINISVDTFIALNNGGIITSTLGPEAKGSSGQINIQAHSIAIRNQSGISTVSSGIGDSGAVVIDVDELTLVNDSVIASSTSGSGNAGRIQIFADNTISLIGGIDLEGVSGISSLVDENARGSAGNLEIDTNSLILSRGAILTSATAGEGNAGNITIRASKEIALISPDNAKIGNFISSGVDPGGNGDAGLITIETGSLSLAGPSEISTSTSGQGNSSIIDIEARDSISLLGENSALLSQVNPNAEGSAGNIELITNALTLSDGAQISTSTVGIGDAGSIFIDAGDKIILSNNSQIIGIVGENATGNAQQITLDTPTLTLIEDSIISAESLGNGNTGGLQFIDVDFIYLNNSTISTAINIGAIVPETGNITLQTQKLELSNGSLLAASTSGQGAAGSITVPNANIIAVDDSIITTQITATAQSPDTFLSPSNIILRANRLSLANNARVLASTEGAIDAGSVTVIGDVIDITQGSTIETLTRSNAQAGEINIESNQHLLLSESNLLAQTEDNGNAGDITINTPQLTIANGATVSAQTSNAGNGGSIIVTAPDFFTLGPNSQLTVATSGAGEAGDIEITSNLVTIGEDAQLSAIATDSATNLEGGGSININTATLNISGQLGIFANTQGPTPAGTLTLQPNGDQSHLKIKFIDESGFISASTTASGQGGDINISAPQSIDIRGGGAIAVETTGRGDAGNIDITTHMLTLAEGANITASTTGAGNAGRINLNAKHIDLQDVTVNAITAGAGNAGSITLSDQGNTANTVNLNHSSISTEIRPQGQANQPSNIDINTERLDLNTSTITASTAGNGDAGNITVANTDTITLNQSEIIASTSGTGNTGVVTLSATQSVDLNNSRISSSVNQGAVGDAQQISINTTHLSLIDSSEISAATAGEGNAGNILIQTAEIIALNDGRITSSVQSTGVGQGGNIDLNTQALMLTNGAEITASTAGYGAAGNIFIPDAQTVSLDNSTISSAVQPRGRGPGGTIGVNSDRTILANHSQISSSTDSASAAGKITVIGDRLTLTDGSQILTATSNAGAAGDIDVLIQDDLTIIGSGSGLFADTAPESTGAAGNIFVDPALVLLSNGAQIGVSNNGDGAGGRIDLFAGQLTLDNQTEISARSQGITDAGDIFIDVTGLLNITNSEISTTAAQASGGAITIMAQDIQLNNSDIQTNVASGVGGGGTITLDANSIFAFGDSDILAFSQDGSGGDIFLNAPIFLGESFALSSSGLSPIVLDGNGVVNVNATGAISSGSITAPDNSFIEEGLAELPQNFVNTSDLIANSCIVRTNAQQGNFTVTGVGGLPDRPGGSTIGTFAIGSVQTIPQQQTTAPTARPWQLGDPIVEPQGVYRLPEGQLVMSRECSK